MPKKQQTLPKREVTKRRLARWQRERRRRRIILLIGVLVAAVVVGVIVYGVYATAIAPSRRVLSTVDHTSIRASDYVKALRLYSSSQMSPDGLLGILEDNELLRQGAAPLKIAAVTDGEVTDAIKANLFPNDGEVSEDEFEKSYHQLLDSLHFSDTDFRRFIEADLLKVRFDDYWMGQVPAAALQVHARGILLANQNEAQDVIGRLEGGEDFANLAKELSLDTASKESGGDLGWFPEGLKAEEFDDKAFSLEPGTLSEPFSTQQGYWVIQVLEKEDNRPLADDVRQQLGEAKFTDWLKNEREQKRERKVDAKELQEIHEWATEKIG